MLHHSPKEAGDVMTLENAMRGSGDLGAFLACCWGTRLQDPQHPYESASYLENLKQGDFESQPFEATCGPDCRMRIVCDPAVQPAKLQGRRGNKGNKDGKDAAAEAVIKAKVRLPVRKLQEELAALEIERGTTWIAKVRARVQADMGDDRRSHIRQFTSVLCFHLLSRRLKVSLIPSTPTEMWNGCYGMDLT
ncbi:MAG TPA: hypothetical protein VNO32_09260 [Candidatus Acidoferrum sp.]|nr:hypothetical protein [Candidatus Acidoferrum sp.]